MGRFGIAVLLAAVGFPSAEAWSQPYKGVRYPAVSGATGTPYGPTQATHHYQRQYGHPSHGYGGFSANINLGTPFNSSYFGAYPTYGYNAYSNYGGCNSGYGGVIASPGYSTFFGYTAPVPPVINGYPPVLGYNPFNNPQPGPLDFGNDLGLNQPLNLPQVPGANVLPPISTPEAKLKSVRAQAQGDVWFKQQEYHKAYDRYKSAVSEAADRGEAHLRLAVCFVALGHLDRAVLQLKRGLAVDPQFLANADSLGTLYGPGNAIAQAAMVHKATLWAKDDIRDPDRLFLLGALLYLQGDERAPILLETGLALAGGGDHFRSFLVAAQTAPMESPDQSAPVNPQVIDQTPAPGSSNPSAPDSGGLPPLPAPPDPDSGATPLFPLPSGPALPLPNR